MKYMSDIILLYIYHILNNQEENSLIELYLLFALFSRNFINISGTQNFRSPLSCIFICFLYFKP